MLGKFRNYVYLTKQKLENSKPDELLVIGSSHGRYGFDKSVRGGENLCIDSQDLYYSYHLFKLANNPQRKNIALMFSLFSPGWCLGKSRSYDFYLFYKPVFGIDYEYPEIAKERKIYELEEKTAKIIKKECKNSQKLQKRMQNADDLLKKTYHPKRKVKMVHNRALRHLKESNRPINEMRWCEQIMSDSQHNGQNLFVVIPPATSVYREVLDTPDKLFSQVTEMAKKYPNVTILNLFDSPMFQTKHFADCDHLNYKGAKLLTKYLWSEIDKKNKI